MCLYVDLFLNADMFMYVRFASVCSKPYEAECWIIFTI